MTVWQIIDTSGINYEGGSDTVVGIYTTEKAAEEALAEYEKSKYYAMVEEYADYHSVCIVEFQTNKNLWIHWEEEEQL